MNIHVFTCLHTKFEPFWYFEKLTSYVFCLCSDGWKNCKTELKNIPLTPLERSKKYIGGCYWGCSSEFNQKSSNDLKEATAASKKLWRHLSAADSDQTFIFENWLEASFSKDKNGSNLVWRQVKTSIFTCENPGEFCYVRQVCHARLIQIIMYIPTLSNWIQFQKWRIRFCCCVFCFLIFGQMCRHHQYFRKLLNSEQKGS